MIPLNCGSRRGKALPPTSNNFPGRPCGGLFPSARQRVADRQAEIGQIGDHRSDAGADQTSELRLLVDRPRVNGQPRCRRLLEQGSVYEIPARTDRVHGREDRRRLAGRGERDRVVEDEARRDLRVGFAHPAQELGVEGSDEAAGADAEGPCEHGDATRHQGELRRGRRLDLDDVAQGVAVAVKALPETRDPVLPELGREGQLLDFPGREALDRNALAAEHDVLVVEEHRLAVPGLPQVELNRVGAEALGPVQAVQGVLPRAARRPAVPHDPDEVRSLPVAHGRDSISASSSSRARSGSGAAVTGRPTTSRSALAASACAGVATRFWSDTGLPAGRIPGTTVRNPAPQAPRTTGRSGAAQTTPSRPQSRASCARRRTIPSGCPAIGRSDSAGGSSDVRSVTGMSLTPGGAAAPRGGRPSLCPAPKARTLSIAAPERAAAATARSTVAGMSWNFRSRKTRAPSAATSPTSLGPSEVNASRPILNQPTRPENSRAAARTSALLGKSSARQTLSPAFIPPLPLRAAKLRAGARARRGSPRTSCAPRNRPRARPRAFRRRPDP